MHPTRLKDTVATPKVSRIEITLENADQLSWAPNIPSKQQ